MKNVILSSLVLFLVISVKAQSFSVGQLVAGGSGCLGGNIGLSVSNQALQLDYSQMHIVRDQVSRISRIACNIAIPVSLPPGFQLVVSASSNGEAVVSGGDRVSISQELFAAGSIRKPVKINLNQTNGLRFQVGKLGVNTLKSVCGQDVILRLNLNATVIRAATSTSTDVAIGNTKLAMNVMPCQ